MKRSSFYLPFTFLILTFILLILPGNDLPKQDFFSISGLDKAVHITMFCVLILLFYRPFKASVLTYEQCKKWFIKIALSAFIYGVTMEFIQKFFIPYRSFELADIGADCIGIFIGYVTGTFSFLQAKRA